MSYRIIKENHKDGTIKYKVQSNRKWFGLRKTDYHTVIINHMCSDGQTMLHYPAEFDSLDEAKKFIGNDTNPVIDNEVVYQQD